jgi:hypothetical protein
MSECSETYNLLHGACGCDNNKQAIFVPFNGLDQMLNQMGSAYYSNMFVWDYQPDQLAIQRCFSLTKNQPDQLDFSPSEQAVGLSLIKDVVSIWIIST